MNYGRYLNKYEIGPKTIFDNDEYRIESFVKGLQTYRPARTMLNWRKNFDAFIIFLFLIPTRTFGKD